MKLYSKRELATAVARHLMISNRDHAVMESDVEAVLDALSEVLVDVFTATKVGAHRMTEGDYVSLGPISFVVMTRKGRTLNSPMIGGTMQIGDSRRWKLRLSPDLKELVKQASVPKHKTPRRRRSHSEDDSGVKGRPKLNKKRAKKEAKDE